tara:strand:- start:10 stop:210 length:201 start_codon:yes stop_codon:yes gene_type:complete
MTEIDKQLNQEFNKSIVNLEEFLKNLSDDITNLQIDKSELNSLSSLISDFHSKLENITRSSTVEEE